MAVEKDLSNYLIDNNTYEQFNNITNFLLNSTLKDSISAEKAEIDESRFFGDLLVKYHEKELTDVDIYNLINFVSSYNNAITSAMKENILKKVFGMGETIQEELLFRLLTKRVYEILKDETKGFKSYFKFYYRDGNKNILTSAIRTNITSINLNGLNYRICNKVYKYSDSNKLNTKEEYLLFSNIALNETSIYSCQNLKSDNSTEVVYFTKNHEALEKNSDSNVISISGQLIKASTVGDALTNDPFSELLGLPYETTKSVFIKSFMSYDENSNYKQFKYIIILDKNEINANTTVYNINTSSTLLTLDEIQSYGYIDAFVLLQIEKFIAGTDYKLYPSNLSEIEIDQYNITDELNNERVFYSGEKIVNNNTNYEFPNNIKLSEISYNPTIFTSTKDGNKVEIVFNMCNISIDLEFPKYGISLNLGEFSPTESLDGNIIVDTTTDKEEVFVDYSPNNNSAVFLKSIMNDISEDSDEKNKFINQADITIFNSDGNEKVKWPIYFNLGFNQEELLCKKIEDIFLINNDAYQNSADWQKDIFNLFNASSDTNSIKEFFFILFNKEKIIFKIHNISNFVEKRAASIDEIQWASNNNLLGFFDIKAKIGSDSELFYYLNENREKFVDDYNNMLPPAVASIENNNEANFNVAFTVLYKEFNPVYRDILKSYLIESISTKLFNDYGADILFPVSAESSVNTSIQSLLKGISLKENILFSESDLIYTDFYAHPYTVRAANESDLIAFYYGDKVFENGYGKKLYEQEEINNFLDIFHQTRDFFYSVLLNESFVNDDDYALYEKLYISVFAIERFISSKILKLKEIDYFNETDITNFLKTYGLDVLDELLKTKDFINSEAYQKRLLKYFNDLVKNKGSKAVCDLLVKIFDFDDTDITIKKYILAENTSFSDKEIKINGETVKVKVPTESFETSLKFIETPYTTNNSTKDIIDNISSSESYLSFIKDDKYWKSSNCKEEELLELEINTTETKYLGLILKDNFYKKYMLARLSFSVIDFIYRKFKLHKSSTANSSVLDLDDIEVQDNAIAPDPISLNSFSEGIKLLFGLLLKAYDQVTTSTSTFAEKETKYIGINENLLDEFAEGNGEFNKFINSLFIKTTNEYADPQTQTILKGRNVVELKNQKQYILNSLFNEIKDSSTTNTLSTGNRAYQYFKNLNLLLSQGNQFTAMLKEINSELYDDIERNNGLSTLIFEEIYANLCQIPVDYINGILQPLMDEDNNILTRYLSKDFRDLVEKLMEFYYIDSDPLDNILTRVENDSIQAANETFKNYVTLQDSDDFREYININKDDENVVKYSISTSMDNYDELIQEISIRLINMINILHDVFESYEYLNWSISIQESENNQLTFLKETINIFLSYTSQLYVTKYLKSYDTASEGINIAEDTQIKIEQIRMDSVYYDESLKITKQ